MSYEFLRRIPYMCSTYAWCSILFITTENGVFAVCTKFTVGNISGTRQTTLLPCVIQKKHDKYWAHDIALLCFTVCFILAHNNLFSFCTQQSNKFSVCFF